MPMTVMSSSTIQEKHFRASTATICTRTRHDVTWSAYIQCLSYCSHISTFSRLWAAWPGGRKQVPGRRDFGLRSSALLRCYAAQITSTLRTYRDNPSAQTSNRSSQNVGNHQSVLCNTPEERRSHL